MAPPRRRRAGRYRATAFLALALAGVARAAPSPTQPPAQPVPGALAKRLGPPGLRDQFESARKALHKAAGALTGHDAGRVSLLLQRADEEIARFEDGSGLAAFVSDAAAAREAAGRKDLAGAERALRSARSAAAALTDYTVARPAEVAYRSALAAISDQNAGDFLIALDRLEAATLAPLLLARVHDARAAIARARATMVRNDFPGGRKEVAAARSSLDALEYAGALSRACYGLMAASELLHDRAPLNARDQIQRSLRELALAQELAPEADRGELAAAHDGTVEVWRRINHPVDGDPGRLAAASQRIEKVRQSQR